MMGLDEIRKANENPKTYADSGMSDAQQRRNDDKGKAFWSETVPYAETAIPDGESMDSMRDKGLKFLSAAADHGRLNEPLEAQDLPLTTVLPLSEIGFHAEPSNPVPGSGWGEFELPSDAFRPVGAERKPWVAEQTMTQYVPTVEEQIKAQPLGNWEFETVRLLGVLYQKSAQIKSNVMELQQALQDYRRKSNSDTLYRLRVVFQNADRPEYTIAKKVEDIIHTSDAVAPPPKMGYNAKLSLNYAFKPIRDALAKLINL